MDRMLLVLRRYNMLFGYDYGFIKIYDDGSCNYISGEIELHEADDIDVLLNEMEKEINDTLERVRNVR